MTRRVHRTLHVEELEPRIAPAGIWAELGGSASGTGISSSDWHAADPSLAIGPDGSPVAAWCDVPDFFSLRPNSRTEDMEVYVRRWNGSFWEELGSSATGGGISDNMTGSFAPSVAVGENGQVFVAWADQAYLTPPPRAAVYPQDPEIYVRTFVPEGGCDDEPPTPPGTCLDGNNRTLRFLDSDGDLIKLIFSGPGQVWITDTTGGALNDGDDIGHIQFVNTTEQSCFIMKDLDQGVGHHAANTMTAGLVEADEGASMGTIKLINPRGIVFNTDIQIDSALTLIQILCLPDDLTSGV